MSSDKPLIKKSFSLNVLTLAGGTAFAQAIGLAAIPLITRLYTPADFGNYALYTSVFNLLVPLVHLRYALAIMLPKEEQEALEVLRLSLKLSIIFGITLFTFFFIGGFSFFPIPEALNNSWVPALICLALIFGGFTQSYTEWSNRVKNYFLMSLSRVAQVGGMVAGQSVTGLIWGSTLPGLITGHILGSILGLGTLMKGNKTLKGKSLFFSPIDPLIGSMVRYKKFPLYNSWGSFLDGVSAYGTPLLLAIYFQPDTIGKYALAHTALAAPVMLIGHSISEVLCQRMAENLKNGLGIDELVRSILLRLALISLSIGLIVYFFGPVLFGFFFGDQWLVAGQFAQILVPAMFFQLISTGLQAVMRVKERFDLLLWIQVIRAIITIASIAIPGMAGFNETELLTVFSVSRAVAHIAYLTIILKVARVI